MKRALFLIIFLIGTIKLSAQINNMDKKIIGMWYHNKGTTMTEKILADVDTICFNSDNTFKWIINKDSILIGTWKRDTEMNGIRLKMNLTEDEIDWYKSYGVKEADLGRIDLSNIVITKDSFSFLAATEENGKLRVKYLRKR